MDVNSLCAQGQKTEATASRFGPATGTPVGYCLKKTSLGEKVDGYDLRKQKNHIFLFSVRFPPIRKEPSRGRSSQTAG